MSDNLYKFHWRGSPPSEGRGDSPADAMNKLGYGQGAVAALDYWEFIPENQIVKELIEL